MQQQETSEPYDSTRKRSPNFTGEENKVLNELVQVYEEQIERKKTDHASNVIKNRAWHELAKDFNGRLGHPYRSPTVLKHRYENMKKEFRRTMRYRRQTNEMPAGADQVQNYLENSYTNDTEADYSNTNEFSRIIVSDDNEEMNGFTETVIDDCDLIGPPDPKIEKTWHQKSDDEDDDDDDGLKSVKKRCFLEEHKLKLSLMEKKHILELDLIKQEHKARMNMMRQEHDMKMKLLDLERTLGIINKI
ncbi:unnamed protein product [Ceutorhynchus assimilis]|uniref:Regulatory protein zeste n=1 Tax=Ceutorhynchus assimilis TaxID=467358 RepID=A0A9N9MID2_9CUCU|nr:unnamed protein product [Ceutorhynchus assimilis]